MANKDTYATWLEIDLDAIRNNLRRASEITRTSMMAVVKANGYGHGAIQVARTALQAGAGWCAVARLEEALQLRQAGLSCPILLLGYTPPQRLDEALANQISMAVWTPAQLENAAAAALRLGLPARLHLKVDTGMGRIGVEVPEAARLAHQLAATPGVIFDGLFTHFARADESDPAFSDIQEARFHDVVQAITQDGLRPPYVHAANSPAGLTRPGAAFDLIRLGIALYGLRPSAEIPLPDGFQPALVWKTVLSHVKSVPPGTGLSYNHEYITSTTERIGTLPVGYADGFRRARPNEVLVHGRRVPVVGRVCMDQMLVSLQGVPQAQPGDEVVIIGEQDGEKISADDLAQRWRTNNYDTVCNIGPRVPRLYADLAPAG
jgi:alanine racemase